VVDDSKTGQDSLAVPTISELLAQYRDRTGASYDEMSRSVDGAITSAWFHKLTTSPPKSFPRDAATVQQLADLLQVSITTILEAFALSLGLPVPQSRSLLLVTMPPGTDKLEPDDVAALRAVIRQLVAARSSGRPELDESRLHGLRLLETDEPDPT
jgi:hypothetical protein